MNHRIVLFCVAMITGCTIVPEGATVNNYVDIRSKTYITVKPADVVDRYAPQRRTPVFSCTSINALRNYTDYGEITRGCTTRIMTKASYLGPYKTLYGTCKQEYKFLVDGWEYYTQTSGGRCRSRRY